jgi:hypothetical protein
MLNKAIPKSDAHAATLISTDTAGCVNTIAKLMCVILSRIVKSTFLKFP